MKLLHLWPIGLFLLIPAILLLYLLKQRAEEKDVSSLYLWREAFQNIEAASPWERLKKSLLMLLQILAMILLIVTMTEPYLTFGGNEYEHVMLLIDNSGSMNARNGDKGRSRLDVAKDMADAYVEGLKKDTMVTILSCGDYPTILAANAMDKNECKRVIRGIDSTCVEGDMTAAVTLAASMMAELDAYKAVIYTDEGVSLEGLQADVVDLSTGGTNGTVDYVNHTDHGESVDVLAKVSNTGTTELRSDVNLYLENGLLEVKEVRLAPGESEILYFKPIPKKELAAKDTWVLSAEIHESDDLNEDNLSYDVVANAGIAKALLVTKQNVFLEKALLSTGIVELYKTTDMDVTDGETFDLILYDGMVPEQVPDNGSLLFVNPDKDLKGFFEMEETIKGARVQALEHDVTKYIEEFTFGLNELKAIRKPEWASSFLRYEEYSAGFIGNYGGRNVAALAFDVHQTDLPLQTEFPILMNNLLIQCVDGGFLHRNKVMAGESVTVYTGVGQEELKVGLPDGNEVVLKEKGQSLTWGDTKKAGLYHFIGKRDGEEREEWLAIGFPASESYLLKENAALGNGNGGDGVKDASLQSGRNLDDVFLVLVLLLVIVEWFVYIQSVSAGFLKKGGDRKGRALKRYAARLVIRLALIVLLLLALADVAITRRTKSVTTVFLVDVSDSTASHRLDMQEAIRNNIGNIPNNNQVGIVAFGSDSKVEQFVTDQKRFHEFQTNPITTATNMEQAVQAAMALFPEKSAKRLVIISDGRENAGSLANMAANVRNNQVEVLAWKLSEASGDEAYVSDMKIPEKIRVGDVFSIQVDVESNVATEAVLRLLAGTKEIGSKQISLEKGLNTFLFQETCEKPGVASYHVLIEPVLDTVAVNNEYVAFTEAEEGNEILLIEGDVDKADEFVKVLHAANIAYKRIYPDIAPEDVHAMNAYSCIVLLDVYADDLSEGFLSNVETYVKDYAGGLIAIGGENSFALGNYKDSPLETVLPVNMDLEGENEIPKMAIAMVVDHSGSMSAGEGGVTQLDLAKEAAVGALKALRKDDLVGVLAFDDTYNWVVKLQNLTSVEEIAEKIDGIPIGGGTSIFPALEEARKEISGQDAKIKHVILLTDGQDGFRDYDDLIEQINKDDVTLSTVAVGGDADLGLLEYLAGSGGGRSYVTDVTSDIPRIFMKEVFLSAGEYLKNKEFTPIVTSNSEIIRDVSADGLPSMLGYVASTVKPLATTHLVSDENEPILTTWQYGLGKTAAFNSDGENKWTANYAGWEAYPALWRNLIDWCITEKGNENSNVQIKQSGNKAVVKYATKEYTPNSEVEMVSTDDEGNVTNVKLEAKAPGTFEAELELDKVGIYGVNVTRKEGGEVKDTKNTAVALQYSAEYRFVRNETVLEEFVHATGGNFMNKEDSVFLSEPERVDAVISLKPLLLLMAAFLFFFDIANRRIYPSLVSRLASRAGRLRVTVVKRRDAVKEGMEAGKGEKADEKKDARKWKETEDKNGAAEGKDIKVGKGKGPEQKTKRNRELYEEKSLDIGTLLDKKNKRGL